MNRPAAWALFELHLAVTLGRLREAARRRLGVAGIVAAGAMALLSGSMLALAAIVFGGVGTMLISTLASAERETLAAVVAGAMADATLTLTLLTMVLSDTHRTGLDRRPLLCQPVREFDLLVLDLLSVLFLQPTAFVIWPASLALFAASVRFRPASALLGLPAAVGLALLTASVAVFFRRLLTMAHSQPEPFRPWLRAATLVVPLVWLAGAGDSVAGAAATPPPVWSVGYWIYHSQILAWAGDGRALAFGLAPHLLAVGVLASTRSLPWLEARLVPSRRRGGSRSWLPAEVRRVWGPTRSRAILVQALITGALVLGLGVFVDQRGFDGLPVAAIATVLAAWTLVTGTAAPMSNALGIGGRAGSLILLAAHPVRGSLLPAVGALGGPVLAGLGLLLGVSLWLFDDPAAALAGLAGGGGALLAGLGVGAWLSVTWPRPAPMEDEGDPTWAAGPARLLMPLAQGMPLAPLVSTFARSDAASPLAATSASLAIGAGLGLAGAVLAARRLRRRLPAVAEALSR
ncbi:MAG: hypothetical protein Q9Q40_14800 [Acidobacteriota bacterium]|nr:hypothetical protein [Acidobacteriota bacterium]